MAWIKPQFRRDDVNRAGEVLISPSPSEEELDSALAVINNWRAIHACPLQTIKMTLATRAQHYDTNAIIATATVSVTPPASIGTMRAVMPPLFHKIHASRFDVNTVRTEGLKHAFDDVFGCEMN